MNVYDFDGTIYCGDSSVDFYKYCIRHYKNTMRAIPYQLLGAILYTFHRIDKTSLKEHFFYFLNYLDDPQKCVTDFWTINENKIEKWYLFQQREDDVVISASPAFLLVPICNRNHISKVIASNVDIHTGVFYGKNCRGAEKVIRFKEEYPNSVIDNFYSDTDSDGPMAKCAASSYKVKNSKIYQWDD